MSNNKKSFVIASILIISVFVVAFTGMAITKTGPFDPGPPLSVQVFDGNGFPLANASIQGIMYNPPSRVPGTTTLFVVNTNKGGYASINNLTPVKNLLNEWVKYQGADLNSISHPDLLLLATYHDSTGTFLSIGSVDVSTAQIANGHSFKAIMHVPLDKNHKLIPTAKPSVQAQTSVVKDGSTLPTFIPDGPYFYWEQDYANYTPITRIPVAFAYIYGDAEAYINANAATTLNYNVGFALNPGSTSSVKYNAGGSGYSTSSGGVYSFDSGEMVYTSSNDSTGYVYINAQVEGANYSLWYINPSEVPYPIPMNEYFYDVGIVNVQLSGSNVQSSTQYGVTTPIGNIEAFNSWHQQTAGQAGQGIGNIGSQFYQISMKNLVEQYTSTDTSWINFGVGLGAILLSFISPPVGVGLSVLGVLFGTIQFGSGFSISSGYVQYDAPTNYDINTYVVLSGSQYYLTNGYTGYVPMLGVEVYAYQISSGSGGSSGGGGGCVLNGTEITLANRTTIPVQDLRPGMKVMSYDTSVGSLIQSTVSKVTETNVSNILELNHQIYISGMGDQPVFVKLANGSTKWLILGKVDYGMSLFDPLNNTWIPVTSITLHNGHFIVYDVITARQLTTGGHTSVFNDYIANGVLLDLKIA